MVGYRYSTGAKVDSDGESGKPRGSTAEERTAWPLVEFNLPNGAKQQLLCEPREWTVELPNGEVQASRTQVPLILAWALSIHKAQGQTLARVRVDLTKAFEKGQVYVSISRATTREGLQVLGFDKSNVMVHPRVVAFYQQLSSAENVD